MNDYIIRAVTGDGGIRAFAAVTTKMVDTAREIHNTTPCATAAFGRVLTATAIMGSMLKSEKDSISLQIDGKGPIGRIVAISDCNASVKGYVDNPIVDLPLKKGKLDVGGAVGTDGVLGIVRDFGLKEPYVGKVPLATGEIGDDLALYFARSEQIPSIVALGVLVDVDLSVKASGGLIVQVMPEATDEDITKLEKMAAKMKPITQMLDEGATPEDIIAFALSSFDSYTFEEQETRYQCDCSMDRIDRAVRSLGAKEIKDIIEKQGQAELTCHFCNKHYTISKETLEAMIK